MQIWPHLPSAILKLSNIYARSKLGPEKIGPIQTSLYKKCYLEEGFLGLFDEALAERKSGVWSVLLGIWYGIGRKIASGIVNRFIMEYLYDFIYADRIAHYIKLSRYTLWPGGTWASDPIPKSEAEILDLRRQLKSLINKEISGKKKCQDFIFYFFGQVLFLMLFLSH